MIPSIKNFQYGFLFSAAVLLSACQSDNRPAPPDVSGIEAEVDIRRFEQELFTADTSNMASELQRLEEPDPGFADIYFNQILGGAGADSLPAYVQGFLSHPPARRLYDTTQLVFGDMSEFEAEFEQAFRYFQYYFPGEPVPTVTTFISEYTIAAFVYGDNQLGVGLDFFLGPDYPYQQYNPSNPAFSAYLSRTFTPEHLVSKTVQALINGLAGEPGDERLLGLMIHNGKKLYALDLLLPYSPDSIKLEVSAQQAEWLENNELEMWAYLIKEELIYSSDWQQIRKYVDYSPHSPGMPPEAPGRTANWLGWQIVKAYMENHPGTTLPELFALQDAQALLDASKYKPERAR